MKDFLRYSKNRLLYSFFKLLILLAIGFVIGSLKVNADTISNYSSNYFYYTENVGAYSTGYRNGSNNKVTLGGTDNQGNNFDYLYGVTSDINYTITKGTRYSVKICLRFTSVGDNEFNANNFTRFNDLTLVYVSPQIQADAVSSVYDVSQPLLLQYDVCSTYNITALQNNSSFALGFKSNSYNSFGIYKHKYSIIASINSIDVFEGGTSIQPIIDQNNTIINQNQTAENTRKGIWETIKSIPSTIGNFFDSLGTKIGTFFDNLATKIGNFFKDLLDGIIDGLKTLFIPEDGYFETWFNNFKNYFEVKLGFLATPFTIFIDFVNSYLELDSSNDIIIDIPDITVPNFEENKIVSATSFNWSQTLKSKESLNTLWQLYLSFIDVYLILNFINLCENKYNRIFGGDTSNYEYYTVEDSYTFDNDTGEVLSSRRNERTTTRKKVDK